MMLVVVSVLSCFLLCSVANVNAGSVNLYGPTDTACATSVGSTSISTNGACTALTINGSPTQFYYGVTCAGNAVNATQYTTSTCSQAAATGSGTNNQCFSVSALGTPIYNLKVNCNGAISALTTLASPTIIFMVIAAMISMLISA
jgi:hypothetical protein